MMCRQAPLFACRPTRLASKTVGCSQCGRPPLVCGRTGAWGTVTERCKYQRLIKYVRSTGMDNEWGECLACVGGV
jgi:hypothetical protein